MVSFSQWKAALFPAQPRDPVSDQSADHSMNTLGRTARKQCSVNTILVIPSVFVKKMIFLKNMLYWLENELTPLPTQSLWKWYL